MKQELQDKLIEVIDSIQSAATVASDFALEQLPDIAQQYVIYGRAKSVITFVVMVLISTVLLKYAHWAYKNKWNTSPYSVDSDRARSDSNLVAIFVGCAFGLLFAMLAFIEFDLLVWVAPKVWLMKELAMLVK